MRELLDLAGPLSYLLIIGSGVLFLVVATSSVFAFLKYRPLLDTARQAVAGLDPAAVPVAQAWERAELEILNAVDRPMGGRRPIMAVLLVWLVLLVVLILSKGGGYIFTGDLLALSDGIAEVGYREMRPEVVAYKRRLVQGSLAWLALIPWVIAAGTFVLGVCSGRSGHPLRESRLAAISDLEARWGRSDWLSGRRTEVVVSDRNRWCWPVFFIPEIWGLVRGAWPVAVIAILGRAVTVFVEMGTKKAMHAHLDSTGDSWTADFWASFTSTLAGVAVLLAVMVFLSAYAHRMRRYGVVRT
ncbi:hypothetical protein H8E07_07010 [bacterium]|nr:hypothetical protein [bacterium]